MIDPKANGMTNPLPSTIFDTLSNSLKLLTLLAAGLAPALLIAGYSFHVSYLAAFDVDVMLLPMALSDNVGTAWYMGVLLIAKLAESAFQVLGYALLAFIWLLFVLFVFIMMRHKGWLSGLFDEHNEDNPGPLFLSLELYRWKRLGTDVFEQVNKGLNILLVAFVTCLLVPLLLIITPAQKGTKEGLRQRTLVEAVQHDCTLMREDKLECIEITRGKSAETYRGLFITGTERFVVLFNADGVTVLERGDQDKILIQGEKSQQLVKQ